MFPAKPTANAQRVIAASLGYRPSVSIATPIRPSLIFNAEAPGNFSAPRGGARPRIIRRRHLLFQVDVSGACEPALAAPPVFMKYLFLLSGDYGPVGAYLHGPGGCLINQDYSDAVVAESFIGRTRTRVLDPGELGNARWRVRALCKFVKPAYRVRRVPVLFIFFVISANT